ncbi:MAG: DNA polymerase III subunit beta [SAR324 cluster bacterium]|jgi:DNA polymerase-3 subunit beta|nr:DNA polymerase III subunit beta [Deltaproteobacteria bacterium]MBT4185023.1 DNA polymerase III subunit beta [Deltaproteobacteria bacterium]MBT4628665.1 DNA polymerase III subunit beta [Deltaproteobacteria bacterium]MBT7809993.1 DNA polymerase III subunit beta [Deltaproteobacteria bacterium]MDG1861015.1 DNA polymerase III subunit beta [SAR324 cluster bacterium]|tara:strand:- start:242 stop:1369 length:1128 start_codon:yes stop_codon:yes gene_type:complete
MEINLKREAFSSTLQNINSVVDKSTSSNKPILSNFVIRTMEGEAPKVEFSSTDYELSLVEQVEAEITEPGSICVNAKKVFDIVKELQDEDVKIRSTEQLWIHITCGSSEMRLPSVEVGLYPQTVLEELPQSVTISVDDLKQCIDMTLFAAITNESRRNLMGVCLSSTSDQQTRWLSTDGHRLAQILKSVDDMNFSEDQEVIVPRKVLTEVRRVADLFGQKVVISFNERVMQFTGSRISFKTRLIEGKFPNCDPIIPKDNTKQIIVNRESFINSLRIVSSISSEKLRPVKLLISQGVLKLESEKADYGEVVDEIEIGYEGDPFQIGFNSRYLLDVLNVIESEDIKLESKNSMSPTIIKSTVDESFLSVIMPLRVEW